MRCSVKRGHPVVVDGIETTTDVGIEHPVDLPLHEAQIEGVKGTVLASAGAKPVAEAFEVAFIHRSEDLGGGPLHDLVFNDRDGDGSPGAVGFGDVMPLRGNRSVDPPVQSHGEITQVFFQPIPIVMPALFVDPRCGLTVDSVVGFAELIHIADMVPELGQSLLSILADRLSYPLQRM